MPTVTLSRTASDPVTAVVGDAINRVPHNTLCAPRS